MLSFVESVARWAIICIATASPWLHQRREIYTVVSVMDVEFSMPMGDFEITEFYMEWIKKCPDSVFTQSSPNSFVITMPKERYKEWDDIFEFKWEKIQLKINKDFAQFVDENGRISVCTFFANGKDDWLSIDNPRVIPWLTCLS
jgi:hypothetical protein